MNYQFYTFSVDQTLNLGKFLASHLNLGDSVLLKGDLGAGKTTLTKGIALGLNINEKVNSPTFNILKLYLKGDKPLFHIDAYRLENITNDIGLSEYIGSEGITVIEWPDYIKPLLPEDALTIFVRHISLNERLIIVEGNGRFERLINELMKVQL